MENILQIADLTKRYPDFYLDHLTLNVPSGSIVGLIGENGAGQSESASAYGTFWELTQMITPMKR